MVFTEAIYRDCFSRTLSFAAVAIGISLLISYPVAYYLSRLTTLGSLILLTLLLLDQRNPAGVFLENNPGFKWYFE